MNHHNGSCVFFVSFLFFLFSFFSFFFSIFTVPLHFSVSISAFTSTSAAFELDNVVVDGSSNAFELNGVVVVDLSSNAFELDD